MKSTVLLFLVACLAGLPGLPDAAQAPGPDVSIIAQQLCTNQLLPLFDLRADVTGMTPPLRLVWDLGGGQKEEGQELPELSLRPGYYNVVLTVTDAAGLVKKASITVDAMKTGCTGGGGF